MKIPNESPECPRCNKNLRLCFCDQIKPAQTKVHVLILQHPQEPDKDLGSAKIANLALANSTLKIGLSWPNLTKALGRPAQSPNWGVLYLGGKNADEKKQFEKKILKISKKDKAFSVDEANLEGIVVLDGTWSQAKALWWRNPWLLKLKRLTLNPQKRSLYGKLRKEPRRECLSTIEAISETLRELGEDHQVCDQLCSHFSELIRRYEENAGN